MAEKLYYASNLELYKDYNVEELLKQCELQGRVTDWLVLAREVYLVTKIN